MTIAVGVIQGDPTPGVWLAADTLAIGQGVKHHVRKIQKCVDGTLAFVTAGSLLGRDIARDVVNLRSPGEMSMVDLARKLRTQYQAFGWKCNPTDGGPEWWDQSFLVTDGSSLWHVACDLHPLEFQGHWAIGNGVEVALGSLHTSQGRLLSGIRATLAVEAACEYAQYCGGEVESVFVPRGERVLLP